MTQGHLFYNQTTEMVHRMGTPVDGEYEDTYVIATDCELVQDTLG